MAIGVTAEGGPLPVRFRIRSILIIGGSIVGVGRFDFEGAGPTQVGLASFLSAGIAPAFEQRDIGSSG